LLPKSIEFGSRLNKQLAQILKEKEDMARIVVMGLGYVGITTAVGMASLGHEVMGFDIDIERVATLSSGKAPIHEAGIERELENLMKSGNLSFTKNLQHVSNFQGEFFFVCVPTPQDSSGAANLSFVLSVARDLESIAPPNSVVILKSTVPVGSGLRVTAALNRPDVHVASNPEFLREGTALQDFFQPDRIVAGAKDEAVSGRILHLYNSINAKKIATTIESAELVKYSANAYLAMRLSFVNDIAALCEKIGANVDDVMQGLGSDSRIGPSFLSPGPGWGGSCFPKDTRALISVASDFGIDLPLIDAALESNEAAFARVVESIRDLAGGQLEGKVIAAWGAAFKAHTDDIRDSPAINIITRLLDRGCEVRVFDPVAIVPPMTGLNQFDSALEAAKGADVLTVLTEWPEFSTEEARNVARVMRGAAVLDTRRVLPSVEWIEAVSNFRTLGG
jgi:UDPglucose 6-dehydrogenase